ncbi:MAG: NAD(P)H-dependent oxidoreductase subunit E [Ilumatobacteraceae bacterium]
MCRAEACQARGAAGVWEAAVKLAEVDPDLEVAEVFCLGNCASGPSIRLDGRLIGDVSPERVPEIVGNERDPVVSVARAP